MRNYALQIVSEARWLLLQRCCLQTPTVHFFLYKTMLLHAPASHIFISLNEWSDSATVLLYNNNNNNKGHLI